MEEITEVSGGWTGWGSRPQAAFRRHQWPVTLRHGPAELAPIRIRDRASWDRCGPPMTWLRPWDTRRRTPRWVHRHGRVGSDPDQTGEGYRTLPWLVFYDLGQGGKRQLVGQLTVSGIVGGSASWGQIGYWIDERYAGRGSSQPRSPWRSTTARRDEAASDRDCHPAGERQEPESRGQAGFRPEGLLPTLSAHRRRLA